MTGSGQARAGLSTWPALAGAAGASTGLATAATATVAPDLLPALVLAAAAAGVAVLVGLRWFLLGVVALDLPLQVDLNLGYDEAAGLLGAFGGLNVSATTGAVLGLLALRIAPLDPRPAGPRTAWRPWRTFAVYVAFVGASVAAASDRFLALAWTLLLLQSLLLLWLVATTLASRTDVQTFVSLLLLGVIAESLLCLAQAASASIALPGLGAAVPAASTFAVQRVTGTFGSPNVLAGYFAVLLPLALAVLVSSAPSRHRAVAGNALLLGALGLAATVSRGGLLAFALATTILTVIAVRRRWVPYRFVVRLLIALVACALLTGRPLLERIQDDRGAFAGRGPLLSLAADMIADKPLLGVGANNFVVALRSYATPEYGDAWLYVVHNEYLLVWAESGGAALVVYTLFLASVARRAGAGLRALRSDDWAAPLLAGLLAAVVARTIHMTVDVFNGRVQVQLLVTVVALVYAVRATGEVQGATDVRRSGTDPAHELVEVA